MYKITEYIITRLKSLRIGEAILMSGFFMIGCFFADPFFFREPLQALKILGGVLLYILAVYGLNSYTGYSYDKENPRLQKVGGITRMQYALLTVVFVALYSIIFYSINPVLLAYATFAFGLWCLYYAPSIKLKASFLGGTVIHLAAGIIHFHLGYAALSTASAHSVAIAIYFSLILSAGHLHHELLDYHADKANNIKTTAVRLGFDRALRLMEVLFLFSAAYWAVLYFFSIIDVTALIPFLGISVAIILFYGKWNTQQAGTLRFRLYYRILFFAAGALFIGLRIAGV